MSARAGFPVALLLPLFGLLAVRGEDTAPPSSAADRSAAFQAADAAPLPVEGKEGSAPPAAGPAEALPPPMATPPPSLSRWITHYQPDCCYPFGGHGPINTELYIRNGPSIPAGGGVLNDILDTGWDFQAGGRSLFFNPSVDAAWTADLNISYTYNHAEPSPTVPLVVTTGSSSPNLPAGPGVTIQAHLRDLHRTFANAALGREWYLNAPANASGWKWRAGFDWDGGIGTAKLDVVETRHRTDTIYRTGVGLHTDLEAPCGCCTFLGGFRAEWDYTWMDILGQGNNAQLQDVNLLFTLGVRF